MYNRFAESSRVNYFVNFSQAVQAEQKQAWIDLMTPKGTGLILKSIKTDYKFVRTLSLLTFDIQGNSKEVLVPS